MSDPGAPDWDAIFDRAHRRIATRLILLGGIGALGAFLLLGGGLSAQGTLSLHFGRTAKKSKVVKAPPRRHPNPSGPVEEKPTEGEPKQQPRQRQVVEPPETTPPVIVGKPVCVEEEDASGQQYCNGVPSGGGSGGTSADEGNGGTTAEGEPEPEEEKPEPVVGNPEPVEGNGSEKPKVSPQPIPVAGPNG